MLEYASIRFTESWRPAIKFATVIATTLTHARIGGQPLAHDVQPAPPNDVRSTRSIIANAALFTATAMYVVAGVGAPSYASGVHMWKGTALTLKTRPTSTSASAKIANGLRAPPCASERPIPAKSV